MSSNDHDFIAKKDFERSEPPSEIGVVNPRALASARRKFDIFVLPVVCIYCK
jgi:hypothetical protein